MNGSNLDDKGVFYKKIFIRCKMSEYADLTCNQKKIIMKMIERD